MATSTTYRYITQAPGIQGGQPIIAGTRTPVATIVGYYKQGLSVEEIPEGLPHLTPAQIYEALSYYHDHVEEIERDNETRGVEQLLQQHNLDVTPDGRIISR
jgi:uncharacterized protein (DUF433 family)